MRAYTISLGSAIMIAGAAGPALAANEALPRIEVRQGFFVEHGSGTRFRPMGMNYVRTRMVGSPVPYPWHDTMNPATFDLPAAKAAFAGMRQRGYNVARVFVDHSKGAGIAGLSDEQPLAPAFMTNCVALLRAAAEERVRIIFSLSYTPDHRRYRQLMDAKPKRVDAENSVWFNEGFIDARAAFMADFVRAVKTAAPDAMGAFFSVETENEIHFMATKPPFSQGSGRFEFRGRQYDMADDAEQQRLADVATTAATDACVDAVHKVDQDVMVGVNVFTFRAVGRSGPGHLRTDKTPDGRFPARPLVLAATKASYVDVHFYPMDKDTIDQDYRSIEFEATREACKKAGKPMIVGEIGAFKGPYPTLPKAVAAMKLSVKRLLTDGFEGYIYWTYDNTDQSGQIWNARDGDDAILKALAPASFTKQE
jgi:hypothetical protein